MSTGETNKWPPDIWFKNSNVIGADVCAKAGLYALVKARTYPKEGYTHYVPADKVREARAKAFEEIVIHCGHPDAAEGCRIILAKAKAARGEP